MRGPLKVAAESPPYVLCHVYQLSSHVALIITQYPFREEGSHGANFVLYEETTKVQ